MLVVLAGASCSFPAAGLCFTALAWRGAGRRLGMGELSCPKDGAASQRLLLR